MFKKLFGETEEEQLQYLEYRSLITLGLLAVMIVASLLYSMGANNSAGGIRSVSDIGFAIVMMFIWGMPLIRRLFGIVTLSAFFSRSAIIGLLLFLAMFFMAYLFGTVFAVIGVIRYLYLKTKKP